MRDRLQILCLGFLLLTMPPAFRSLAAAWYPELYGAGTNADQHYKAAQTLRHRFRRSTFLVVATLALVLLLQYFRKGGLSLATSDCLRIAAAVLALIAALGRGGWTIQSWSGNNPVERIDRGLYLIEQLGAAALLVFVLTL
jgi:hypothetical protein